MARAFSGTQQVSFAVQLRLNGLTAISIGMWMKIASYDGTAGRKWVTNWGGGGLQLSLSQHGALEDRFAFFTADAGTNFSACVQDGPLPSAGTWFYFLLTWKASPHAFAAYINGTPETVSVTSSSAASTGPSTDPLLIGATSTGLIGSMQDLAIWDVVLTAVDAAALARGFTPAHVRPQNRVFYSRLIGGDSTEADLISGITGTVTGATKDSHQRVYS